MVFVGMEFNNLSALNYLFSTSQFCKFCFKFTIYDVHRFEKDPVVICHIWAIIIQLYYIFGDSPVVVPAIITPSEE